MTLRGESGSPDITKCVRPQVTELQTALCDSAILLGMSEGLLFLKPLHLNRYASAPLSRRRLIEWLYMAEWLIIGSLTIIALGPLGAFTSLTECEAA